MSLRVCACVGEITQGGFGGLWSKLGLCPVYVCAGDIYEWYWLLQDQVPRQCVFICPWINDAVVS